MSVIALREPAHLVSRRARLYWTVRALPAWLAIADWWASNCRGRCCSERWARAAAARVLNGATALTVDLVSHGRRAWRRRYVRALSGGAGSCWPTTR